MSQQRRFLLASRRHTRWLSTMLVATLLVIAFSNLALACPGCKDTLAENDANSASLVRGYFWSILFMMSMPFLILGGLSSYMYLEVRRARSRTASETNTLEPLTPSPEPRIVRSSPPAPQTLEV